MAAEQLAPTEERRSRALEETLKALDKRWGKGAVMRLGERSALEVDVLPTGSLSLDDALGVEATRAAG